MRIIDIALFVLILGVVTTFLNISGGIDHNYEELDINTSQIESDTGSIFEIDTSESVETKESLKDKLLDWSGLDILPMIWNIIVNTLKLAFNLGGVIGGWIGGSIGAQFAIVINVIVYFLYIIGGIQLWRKVSTRGMD